MLLPANPIPLELILRLIVVVAAILVVSVREVSQLAVH